MKIIYKKRSNKQENSILKCRTIRQKRKKSCQKTHAELLRFLIFNWGCGNSEIMGKKRISKEIIDDDFQNQKQTKKKTKFHSKVWNASHSGKEKPK